VSELLGELARTLATPMSRSRAVKLLGATLVSAAFPIGRMRPAEAASVAGCAGKCAGQVKCCKQCPGKYGGILFICCAQGQTCRWEAPSAQYKCGRVGCKDATRCKKGERACGDKCCKQGQTCCDGKCCPADEKCCPSKTCCKRSSSCCGEKCCSDTQRCCGDHCCRKTNTRCGKGCCPEGTICARAGNAAGVTCCPEVRVARGPAGKVCCPPGYYANDQGTCCPTGRACTDCDPPCRRAEYCQDGYCLPAP
jgi:hypothetical protein